MNETLFDNASRPRAVRSLFTVLASALLVGCISTPPQVAFTFIEPTATSAASTPLSDARHALRLVAVQGSAGARESLTWRDGSGSVVHDDRTRWATTPADFVRRAALEQLATLPPSASSPERRLSIDVTSFGVTTSGQETSAEVRLFAVVEERDGRLVSAREYAAVLPVGGGLAPGRGDYTQLCAALGSATAQLVFRIVADAVEANTAE